jgi:hypothetical protein
MIPRHSYETYARTVRYISPLDSSADHMHGARQ